MSCLSSFPPTEVRFEKKFGSGHEDGGAWATWTVHARLVVNPVKYGVRP